MKQNACNLNIHTYSLEEMLEEWKTRKMLLTGRRDCTVERDDGIDLDAVLTREIEAAYDCLLREAPAEWLPVNDIAENCSVEIADDLTAVMHLPVNCYRVVEVKLPSWKHAVSHIVSPDSETARQQQNEWLRGGVNAPVCVAGNRRLYLYSAGSHDELRAERVLAVEPPEKGWYAFADAAWDFLLSSSQLAKTT